MARRPNKALAWAAESLNEYADLIDRGEPVPHHAPSSPRFWFDGLARELAHLRGSSWEDSLTPFARERFQQIVGR